METKEDFKRTKVFATNEEIRVVKEMFKCPQIVVGNCYPPNPWHEIDRLSVKHGLPETTTQRGMDLETGEFLEHVSETL